MTLDHILVATDFSPDADAALAYAFDLASSTAASVHLMHVVEEPLAAGMWASEIYTAELAGLQLNLVRDAETRLRESVPADRTKVPVTLGVRTGRAAPAIVDVAREIGADLIVLGARGRTRMARALIGGVAERIVRSAPCPVLTVHASHPRTLGDRARQSAPRLVLKTILVPTDFSEPADRALDFAKALAARFGASLHIVHVFQDPFPARAGGYATEATRIRERLLEEAHRRLAATVASLSRFTATGTMLEGRPAEQIAKAAAGTRADLIVMGTHGRSAVRHLLIGSVAERVVRTASCAVLTVRPMAAPAEREPAHARAVVWK